MRSNRPFVLLAFTLLAACSDPEPAAPPAPRNLELVEGARGSQRTVHVRGDAAAGATVRLFADACEGAPLTEGPSSQFGEGGLAVEAAENATFTLVAQAVANGLASPCSEPVSFTHDGLAPESPRLGAFEPPSPSPAPTAAALLQAEPDALVELFAEAGCGGSPLGAVQADSTGAARFAFTPAANRALELHARALDAVLNVSACVALGTFVHDDVAPDRPAVASVTPELSRSTTQPVVAGTTEPGARLEFNLARECNAPVATANADASGAFAVAVPVPRNRMSTFFVRAIDAAGNRSPCSNGGAFFTHDDVAPVRPTLTSTPASPSNSVVEPVIGGTAERGTTVEVFARAGCSGDAVQTLVADANGAFGFTLNAAANTRSELSVRSTDAAGNVSACSAPLVYEHDDVPPAAPVLTGTDPISPSNSVFEPLILGTAEPGATVTLSTTSTCTSLFGTGTADASGNFAVKRGATANSTRTFWAVATDAAGNQSPCSTTSVSYRYDTTAPDAPVFLSTLPPSPATTTSTAVAGYAELGSTVELFADACTGTPLVSGPVATEQWDINGNAYFELPATAAAGATTQWWARARDEAGNVSACSASPIAFTHAGAGWGAASEPGGGAVGHITPALALAGDGSAFAVWTRVLPSGERGLLASRHTAAAGWSAPVELTTRHPLQSASVAADDQGRAMVVWREYVPGADYEVRAVSYSPASGWGTSVVLASGPTTFGARVAMDENGNALAVWDLRASGSAIIDVYAARYTPAGGWETPVLIEQNFNSMVDARIAMDPSGHAVAFFHSATGGGITESLYAAIYTPGSGWGPAELMSSAANESEYAGGIDASGTATVAWVATDGFRSVYARRSSPAGWSTPTSLGTSGSASAIGIAVDSAGDVLATFIEGNALKVARFSTASGWASPVPLTSGIYFLRHSTVFSGASAFVFWENGGALSFRRLTAQGWEAPQLVTGGAVQEHAVRARGGRLGVVWSKGPRNTSDLTIGARFFEP